MQVGNYCKECGHRIHPNEYFCTGCGCKTGYDSKNSDYVFTPPIHDIGFFDFDIDFYPYIDSKNDCTYEICSCGYLNHKDNEFCYMCGAKRSQSRLSKILKRKSKPVFSVDNVLCECGAVNSKENVFCEMCGRQLKDDNVIEKDNFSNFNLEFEDSIFCFCGEENERYSRYCRNCGMPLSNYGKLDDVYVLCTCSTLNEITSDFCIECGINLKKEDKKILCVCGHHNSPNLKFCEVCDRPLNPKRNVKTRIVCSCGEILEWDSHFCFNCGKNIKRNYSHKKLVKDLKSKFR